MVLRRLFGGGSGRDVGERLYAVAVEQARRPEFYRELGVVDEIDARFELYTLHVLLLTMRLRDEGGAAAEAGQGLFDAYVSALDDSLRELGVGDISMPKKMRKLGEQLYGRMASYEPLLAAADADGLSKALAKNLFAREAGAESRAVADYALAGRAGLAGQSARDVMAGRVRWPAIVETER